LWAGRCLTASPAKTHQRAVSSRPIVFSWVCDLSRRTKAPDESCHPDLIAPDFSKGVLPLCAFGKPLCSGPQIGKHRNDLSHLAYLGYFKGALNQRSLLLDGNIESRREHRCGSRRNCGWTPARTRIVARLKPQDLPVAPKKPEPIGEAARELREMAEWMAKENGLTIEQASSRILSDPSRKQFLQRLLREEREATAEVRRQRAPIHQAQRELEQPWRLGKEPGSSRL
jgi:hypothetical protein